MISDSEDIRRRLEAEKYGLGATGEYPHGRLNEDDKGELKAGIVAEAGKVVINFGKPVAWLWLPPTAARELAAVLIAKAAVAEAQET